MKKAGKVMWRTLLSILELLIGWIGRGRRIEKILTAILNNTEYEAVPKSRIEEILLAIKENGEYDKDPQSRNETILLKKLASEEFEGDTYSRIEELLKMWTE